MQVGETVTRPDDSISRLLRMLHEAQQVQRGMRLLTMLVFLDVAGRDGVGVTEVAARIGISVATASLALRRLQARNDPMRRGSKKRSGVFLGLIRYVPANDSRCVRLVLTDKGWDFLDRLEAAVCRAGEKPEPRFLRPVVSEQALEAAMRSLSVEPATAVITSHHHKPVSIPDPD